MSPSDAGAMTVDRAAARGRRPILDLRMGRRVDGPPPHRQAPLRAGRSAVRTIVRGKNLEVPDRVRDYAERKLARLERLLDDRTDAILELSNEAHRSAVGRPHRGRHARDRRHDAQEPGRRRAATRRRSTRSSTRSSARRVDHKEKPRVRSRPERGEGAPPQDRRRHLRRGRERRIVKTKRFAIEPMFEEDAVAAMEELGPRLLRVRERRERAASRCSTGAATATTGSSSRWSAASTRRARRRRRRTAARR